MVTLTRAVRLIISPGEFVDAPINGFAGGPPMRGLGRFYEVVVTCRGEPHPVTGYLINIKDIDRAVRTLVHPIIARLCREAPETDPSSAMPGIVSALNDGLGGLMESVRWALTPYYSVEMQTSDPGTVVLRQRFDFAAAHRLHVASLSDEENRRVFGKCNNPRGHGHNYRVEAAVAVRMGDGRSASFTVADLEHLVAERIIDHFDHTNLNEDTEEFGSRTGVNPSVESIARICYERLAPAVSAHGTGEASLRSVTVWETDRTSSTYPG